MACSPHQDRRLARKESDVELSDTRNCLTVGKETKEAQVRQFHYFTPAPQVSLCSTHDSEFDIRTRASQINHDFTAFTWIEMADITDHRRSLALALVSDRSQ